MTIIYFSSLRPTIFEIDCFDVPWPKWRVEIKWIWRTRWAAVQQSSRWAPSLKCEKETKKSILEWNIYSTVENIEMTNKCILLNPCYNLESKYGLVSMFPLHLVRMLKYLIHSRELKAIWDHGFFKNSPSEPVSYTFSDPASLLDSNFQLWPYSRNWDSCLIEELDYTFHNLKMECLKKTTYCPSLINEIKWYSKDKYHVNTIQLAMWS